MPRRFPSPECCRCLEEHLEETCSHRYLHCGHVSQAWEWIRTVITMLDPTTNLVDDISTLRLAFPASLRDNAIVLMIGGFTEFVETEVIVKENRISLDSMIGYFKQKKIQSYEQSIPELGIIPGIDWNPQGIG